jgi:hypothetical protein
MRRTTTDNRDRTTFQRPRRSTPRAPYHIPWPDFNLFSVRARTRFFLAFTSKQPASCFRPPTVLMYTSRCEDISFYLLAVSQAPVASVQRTALLLRAGRLP